MANVNQNEKLATKVLKHMKAYHGGSQAQSMLLTGAPGIGKTTFAKIFGELVGMKVIIIEIPHITEEHLINIPFIVFNPETNTTSPGRIALTDGSEDGAESEQSQDYKLVLAQSNLYTQLINGQPIPDQKYLQDLARAPAYVQEMFKNLGGTETTIPPIIQGIRQKFKNILFLDEFFRSTTMRIRNILRGLLNHEIGMHRVPSSTYLMYASNMSDTGGTVEETPSNYEFKQLEYKKASKEDWFKWLENQCKTKYNVHLNEGLMKKFKKVLKEEDLSYEDINAEVRTSPRRWEQILLYINSSLPAENRKEAQALMTNIKNNFIHYKEGKYSDLSEKVVKAVSELIKETSNLDIMPEDVMPEEDWKDQLNHMVQQQMKLGEHRKHIPVVSGPPGIGKTTFAHDVALKNNLRLITVSCDNLQPDDVIGMPIPGNKVDMSTQGSDIKVQFSTPVLYQRIMSQIKQADEKYEAKVKKDNPTDAKKVVDQYNRQKYKYLIFFDELNRVADDRTFNGLRKVMLDKDFGPAGQEHGKPLKLPDSAIVVGAINPSGTGTQELTHHFRDVVDFIPAQANWQDIRRYIRGQETEDLKELSPQTKDASMGLIDAFVEKFKSKEKSMSNKRAAFHLDIGGTDVYMSPREYTGLYSSMAHDLDHSVKKLLRDPEITADKLRDGVDEAVFEAFEENLNFPFEKAKYEKEEFMNTLKNWIATLPIETFSGLITTKLRHKDNLAGVLSNFLDGRNITHMPEEAQVTNLNDSMDNAEVVEQFRDCLQDKLVDADSVRKYVLEEKQPKVVSKGKALGTDPSQKVSLFANTVLGLLYTLHINKFKNDRVMIIGKAANKAYGEIVEKLLKNGKIDEDLRDQAGEQVLALRSEISDLMSTLK